jgi:hypothetical protein
MLKNVLKSKNTIFSSILNKVSKFNFSSTDLTVPTIDLDKFTNKREGWEKECKLTADCLHDTGILVIKDSVI